MIRINVILSDNCINLTRNYLSIKKISITHPDRGSNFVNIRLENLVDHWDHICQLAGNSLHIGIGTDLDGNFDTEQAPWDMNSIADLQNYQLILLNRGYKHEDIENIFHKNWIRFLQKA